jgi:hypothetical protein
MSTVLLGVVVVVVSVAVAVGGLLLVNLFVPLEVREAHNPATGTIYAALYVMFGISVGFSLVLVWEQFETARQTAETEAGAVERIYRLADRLPEPDRERVQDLATSYATAVVAEEWDSMARGQASPRAEQLVEDLGAAVLGAAPEGAAQEAVYSESLSRLDDLRETRDLRLLEVREGLPAVVWAVLVSGAVFTVGFSYLLGLRSLVFHALAVGALTAVIAFTIFTIGVLDHPFGGSVRVGPEAFELLVETIEREG